MEKEKEYLLALDISLACTGASVFEIESQKPVEIFSIPTNSKDSCPLRLKQIADRLYEVKNKYNFKIVVLEQGFGRFQISTQMIFRVHGLINYIFYDIPQIYFAPSSIKKIVSGNGKTDKEGIKKLVLEKYPNLELKNNDESDAVSIGMAYLLGGKK